MRFAKQFRHGAWAGGFFAALLASTPALGVNDSAPPELQFLTFDKTAIDTTSSGAEVTLAFTVADNDSGVAYLEAVFLDATGINRRSVAGRFGPVRNGSYTAKIVFPRFSNAGTWTLASVFLSDAAGNSVVLNADALAKRGFPTRLEVTSTRDTTPPRLSALEFAPARIDTTHAPATVTVNYKATDDLSGISYLELSFLSPSGIAKQTRSVRFNPGESVSNSLAVEFPMQSEAGQWTLASLFLADAAGNTAVLDTDSVSRMGFPTGLQVRSDRDTTPPILTRLHFEPDSIDTGQAAATVDVAIQAIDRDAGVKSVELAFVGPSGIAKQTGTLLFGTLKEVNDTIRVNFPLHSDPGRWVLASVFLVDGANNTLHLDAEELAAMGVRTTLDVR